MSEADEFNGFLPKQKLDQDKLSVEIPADQSPSYPDRIPSGYEPMGEVELRGRLSLCLKWMRSTAPFRLGCC